MACHLFSVEPLPESILTCQIVFKKQYSLKFTQIPAQPTTYSLTSGGLMNAFKYHLQAYENTHIQHYHS